LQSTFNLFVTFRNQSRPALSNRTMLQNLLPLATRVLTGEASGAEKKQLREILKQPEPRAWFDRLEKRWQAAASQPVCGFDARDAARRLDAAIRSESTAKPRSNSTSRK
jgi:hypothetical protein